MSATTTLPVPIEFQLPGGWFPADPAEAGAPGMLFVAKHPASSLGTESFAANLTIGGYRRDGADPGDIAEESVRRLRQGAAVRVVNHSAIGGQRAPGVTQLLTLSTTYRGERLELVQYQVYLSLQDVEDARKRAIVELALTCTPRQFGALVDDFGQFVRTVRPRTAGH